MKRIYLAGASAEVEMVADAMSLLRTRGWRITYDWTQDVLDARRAHQSDRSMTDERRSELAVNDIGGIIRADVFWLLVPTHVGSAGAWLELGYALANGRRVIVSGDYRRSIFTALAEERFATHDEAIAWLGEAYQ